MNLNLKKITGIARSKLAEQKKKGAAFIKLMGENPLGKQIIKQHLNHDWYRHIDKAIAGKATSRDEKHWKKMYRTFRKEIVGVASEETNALLSWLEYFVDRVGIEQIEEEDLQVWLPQFRSYIEGCEKNAVDNYIIKNELLEE